MEAHHKKAVINSCKYANLHRSNYRQKLVSHSKINGLMSNSNLDCYDSSFAFPADFSEPSTKKNQ